MIKSPYEIIEKAIITEKGLDVKERARTLVFRVNSHANKVEIRTAVESVFKVKVESVHTARFHGKVRRRGKTMGQRADWKKAYVKLEAGQKMPEYGETA
ncbi:MAG TPA: 50S ribosomal protein L23 [Terriglobia bacterium]|nr:50S ribosomal protein L23 [Terriglobia bacterium]